MAIIAPLIAFLGRFVGKVLTTAFGWASIMLFGRVPQSKQLLLAGVSLGSLLWLAVLVGVVVPDAGTFLIGFVPAPDWIEEGWIRLAMLVLALVLPLAIGVAGLFLLDAEDRPSGGGVAVAVLRGYPYAAVLALVLVVMVVVAPLRKLRSIVKRWEDAHVAVVVQPGGYERVATDVERTLDAAGLEIARDKAPMVLELPSKVLAAVGGESVRRLVPDRLFVLKNRDLEVTLHPSDIAISGKKDAVARSRAAIASEMPFTAAYLTTVEEGQKVEDVLRAVTEGRAPAGALTEVDRRLARLVIPHEEWEVLYRERLQVERELARRRDRSRAGDDGSGPREGLLGSILRLVRSALG
ncbi:MAG TPA: hypothetical protein VHK63_08395 [Candidatus Limnocylindria bacterium]|nr:hypothetical protein [Candidatus Limnocylindria bacterium]